MAFYVGNNGVDGTLWKWGYNLNGELGIGDTNHRSSPVQVGSLTDWKSHTEGYGCLGIKSDGSLWAWGNGSDGSLGLGDTSPRLSPIQVGNLTNWQKVTNAKTITSSIKTDGTLWSWGKNDYGQLGLGDIVDRSSPVQVGNLTTWKEISVFENVSAIKTDGTLWAWGRNDSLSLGLGDNVHRSSPVQVGSLTDWKYVSCGNNTALAIKTDGTLWAWGLNGNGQLGLGNITSRSSPVQVGNLTNWHQVVSEGTLFSSYAIKTDGTLWTWGYNLNGQLGLGDVNHRSSPVQVGSLTNWKKIITKQNIFSQNSVYAIKTDGTLWSWGKNDYGQLGLGDIVDRSSPVQVGLLRNWYNPTADRFDSEISIGIKKSVAKYDYERNLNLTRITKEELDSISSGELWTWGDNASGGLGLGDVVARSSPVQVGLADYWKSYIDSQGRLFIWGDNQVGQLGLGNITSRSSPVQVGNLTNWKQVSFYNANGTIGYTATVKTDGTLWTWGNGSDGRLGSGSIASRSSPVQVGNLTNWKQVDINISHATSIKTDGTLWSWGQGTNGQLGLGDVNHRSSPVQVGSLRNWKYVYAGSSLTTALKTDGTLWAWGFNSDGRLGLGDINHRSSPVQVGSLTDWKQVDCANAHIMAIKTDGTLWAWGYNGNGNLGLGDINHRSSPVQVGSLTNWKLVKSISSTSGHFTFAIKTDGTLWAWGANSSGSLGLGDINHRSSPVQVGSFTDWKELTEIGAIRYGIE